ncbi:hypothetical protein NFI96_020046, partial [Prochilodus magdalenae]
MVEVAGQDGPILVHRPGTLADIKEAMTHLPIPSDAGGTKFGNELFVFCKEFRPTTTTTYNGLSCPDGYDEDCDVQAGRFRVSPQLPDTTHGGARRLTRPQALAGDGGAVTAWEVHLRNSFINGQKPEIAAMVKSLCITWDSGNLSQIQQYAVHTEKLLRERQRKTAENRSKDLHNATLTMLQTARPEEGTGQGEEKEEEGAGGHSGQEVQTAGAFPATAVVNMGTSPENAQKWRVRAKIKAKPTDGRRPRMGRQLRTEE